jgi:hypothetical protein
VNLDEMCRKDLCSLFDFASRSLSLACRRAQDERFQCPFVLSVTRGVKSKPVLSLSKGMNGVNHK